MFKSIVAALCVAVFFSGFAVARERGKAVGIEKQFPADPSKAISAPMVTGDETAGRIDPLLRYTIRSLRDANTAIQKQAVAQKLAEIAHVTQSASGEYTVAVFVKTYNADAAIALVEAAGGTVSTVAGDILTAALPVAAVERLAKDSAIHSLQISAKSKALIDVSRVEINADDVHNGVGLPQPYNGAGVVVGVLDSGIDWKHDDFDWNDGTTRIQYLWDMSGTSNPPSGYNYGREYTKAQIDAGQCLEIDGNGGGGHGTHVAGTAAGSGRAQAGYIGMAPQSDIIFVKGIRDHNSNGGFADTDVVDGVAYTFSKAIAMGKAAAVNLSLGGHFGAHDGTSLYEQALDNLTGPSKIVVAAAGNEGSDYIHGGYATQPGSSYNDALETIWIADGTSAVTLADMWYNTGNISVGIAAYDQNAQLLGWTNPVAPGQSIQNVPFTVSGTTYGLITIDATTLNDPQNNARRVLVLIDSNGGALPINTVFWSLYTFSSSGSPSFDMWVVTGGYFTIDSGTWIRPGDNDKSVGMPGTANQIITVGSYVTKNQWIDVNGQTQQQQNPGPGGPVVPTIGQLSYFSSHGPTRDGRQKPQITAPGEAILAPLSSDLTVGTGVQPQNILLGGKHQKQQGTSMASPHITGVVALMLQKNHRLTPQTVLNLLTSNARVDVWTGTTPNYEWGYGRVDALETVKDVIVAIEPIDPQVPASYELEQNFPNPFNPSTNIRFAVSQAGPVRLMVYNVLGQLVATLVDEPLAAGKYQVDFDASQLGSGIYFYRIEAGSFSEVKKMLLAR